MSINYLLKRLLMAIPTLLGVAIIVFVLLRVVPGDPVAMMIGPEATQLDIKRLRAFYGLDKPIIDQFVLFLGNAFTGDFGTSISYKQDVMELVLGHLPSTLELTFFAIFMGVLFGLLLGTSAVYWKGSWPEAVVDGINGLTIAIPDFLWALLLILFFAVLVPILPVSGRLDPSLSLKFDTNFYYNATLQYLIFSRIASLEIISNMIISM